MVIKSMHIWDGRQINYQNINFPVRNLISTTDTNSRFIMPSMKVQMELHGAAIAIIPSKDNPDIYEVIFNPVAISNVKPSDHRSVLDYRVLDELQFTSKFSILDSTQVKNIFIKIVTGIERLIEIQDKACAEAWVDPQPISIILGQDSRSPVNINALHMQLFNNLFYQDYTPYDFDQLKKDVLESGNLLKLATVQYYFTGSRVVEPLTDMINLCLKSGDDFVQLCALLNKTQLFSNEDHKLTPNDFKEKNEAIRKFQAALGSYLQSTGDDYFDFKKYLENIITINKFDSFLLSRILSFNELSDSDKAKVIETACAIEFNRANTKNHDPETISITFNFHRLVRKLRDTQIKQIQLSQIRNSMESSQYLNLDTDFEDAAKRLLKLSDRLIFKLGDYQMKGNSSPYEIKATREKVINSADQLARQLIDDSGMYYELLDFAKNAGTTLGNQQSQSAIESNTFKRTLRYNFDESAQIRQAFNSAFREAYQGPHNRFIMLGLYKPTPPFVIGLLWMAADQYEILFGNRHPADVEDDKKMRELIMASLERLLARKRRSLPCSANKLAYI